MKTQKLEISDTTWLVPTSISCCL